MKASSALKAGWLVFALLLMGVVGAAADAAGPPVVKITYLYDNTPAVAGTVLAWGFSALVEAHGKRVLFDTGGDAGVLRHNVAVLGLDLGRLDALVLSHEHLDHTNGIPALGRRDGLAAYHPASASPTAPFMNMLRSAGMKPLPVTGTTEIAPGIAVSHELAGAAVSEVALAVDTDDDFVEGGVGTVVQAAPFKRETVR